jgi:hypothetical protein
LDATTSPQSCQRSVDVRSINRQTHHAFEAVQMEDGLESPDERPLHWLSACRACAEVSLAFKQSEYGQKRTYADERWLLDEGAVAASEWPEADLAFTETALDGLAGRLGNGRVDTVVE